MSRIIQLPWCERKMLFINFRKCERWDIFSRLGAFYYLKAIRMIMSKLYIWLNIFLLNWNNLEKCYFILDNKSSGVNVR